ncbi:Alpha/Beta hydrolase protein [Zopfochytrium polystomum]|nr:Alpha/Beta hydrolase protein [Zopfochytrium polystomum]
MRLTTLIAAAASHLLLVLITSASASAVLRDARLSAAKPRGWDAAHVARERELAAAVDARVDEFAGRVGHDARRYYAEVRAADKRVFELTVATGWHNKKQEDGGKLRRRGGGGHSTATGSGLTAPALRASIRTHVQLAATAYCAPAVIAAWNCTACTTAFPQLHSIVQTADPDTNPLTTTAMQGFVGVDPASRTVFAAFRGSVDFANYVQDLSFIQLDAAADLGTPPSGDKPYVHSGFLKSWRAVRNATLAAVAAAAARFPDYAVAFVGHSSGGAVAILAALDATNSSSPLLAASRASVTTAGQPRVGNAAFAELVAARGLGGGVRRGVNYDDIVPHLPPAGLGFRHHVAEAWIDAAGDSVQCDDVAAANNGEDTNCMATIPPWVSTTAHVLYDGVALGGGSC